MSLFKTGPEQIPLGATSPVVLLGAAGRTTLMMGQQSRPEGSEHILSFVVLRVRDTNLAAGSSPAFLQARRQPYYRHWP